MDDVGDDAPDFEGLAGFDFDGWVGGVVGQQVEAAGGGAAETFDGEFAVENGDDDLVVVGVEGAVYEEEVAGVDASTGHGGACDAQEEAGGGCWMRCWLRSRWVSIQSSAGEGNPA